MRFLFTYSPSFLLFLFVGLNSLHTQAQSGVFDFTQAPEKGFRHLAEVVDGDTIPLVNLETVDVITTGVFKSKKQFEQWTRLKYNVRKVYPYAILASTKLKEYDKTLAGIQDKHLKKAFVKIHFGSSQKYIQLLNNFVSIFNKVQSKSGNKL